MVFNIFLVALDHPTPKPWPYPTKDRVISLCSSQAILSLFEISVNKCCEKVNRNGDPMCPATHVSFLERVRFTYPRLCGHLTRLRVSCSFVVVPVCPVAIIISRGVNAFILHVSQS
ncbi:unnamed protein product [Pylaiella littoralis]